MVPGVFDAYLAAMATAAAALVGLLFVAVSVRDDTIFGPNAVPGGEALAITAFTGLVNSFVVSLLGLIPRTNIGEPAVIMAVIGIVATVRLQRRLHTGRNRIVLGITMLAYAAQLGFGVLLLVDPHDSDQLIQLSFIIFATLIVSLQRAWSLLKGKHLASARGTAATGDHDPPQIGQDQARIVRAAEYTVPDRGGEDSELICVITTLLDPAAADRGGDGIRLPPKMGTRIRAG